MKEMITVEKEVYEAVLRNSVRVYDLEAENQKLKDLLGECKYFLAEYDNDFSWDDCVKGYHLRETINKIIGEKK